MMPLASLPGARRQVVAAGRGAAQWLDRVVPPGAMLSEAFLRPVAGILLLGDPRLALPLWLVLLLDPRLALGGLLGLAVGHGLRQALRDEANSIPGGSIGANAFLAGLAAAWITRFSGAGIVAELILILGAAAMASVLALALRRALAGTTLPPMVWAYCATAALLFGLFPEWALRAIMATDWGQAPASMADWWSALLRSFGAFLFSPDPLAGIAIAVAILAWSRIMFVCGLIGWGAGVLVALGFLALGERFYWLPASYNFFLAGMALGASVFLPARRTLVLAAAAGVFASVVSIGMQYMLAWSPAAYLPIPFGLSVWVGIGALRRTASAGLFVANQDPRQPPEEVWPSQRIAARRWGIGEPLLVVPMGGALQITQGFGGALSHAGDWRHALDFQRPLADGAAPDLRESLWDTPVFAPAPGMVEHTRDDVPDNPLGVVNFAENWGNHVVLRLDQGGYAMLAHLRQGTIAVVPGQRVGFGSLLGRVGNSGRSPAPHLHMQAQQGSELGLPTQPFRIANFLTAEAPGERFLRWHAAEIPEEGWVLAGAAPNPGVHALLAGMAPGSATWSVEPSGTLPPGIGEGLPLSVRLRTTLDPAGRYRHRCTDSGAWLLSRLDADGWRPVALGGARQPLLALLAMAVPVLPFAAAPAMSWDHEAITPPPGLDTWLGRSLWPFLPHPFVAMRCHCTQVAADGGAVSLRSEPIVPQERQPVRLAVSFAPIRGPVSLLAEYPEGAITFTQISFEPGLPRPH